MRFLVIVFFGVIFIGCNETAPEPVSMKEDVMALASDALNGRATGTQGEDAAAEYLVKRFESLGLLPEGYQNTYLQEFTFRPSQNPHEKAEFTGLASDSTTTGTNVIAYIDNEATSTVVIGAHYDHLGLGGEGSLYREGQAIHNGADDNASGVAILLRLAETLQQKEFGNQNYLFIAFSGEELGLLGSNYFVKNPTIDLSSVSYMINMDMVGRLNEERTLAVHGVGTSPTFKQTLFANNEYDLNIAEHESGVGPSDHTSFYLMDIPVLHFFTGQHEDYHKPSDDADKLNYEGMEAIYSYIRSIVHDLQDEDKLAFRKTKNESEEVPRFKVALGVVPDYLFTGEGMRIDGVSEDKPAQLAGLKKGDVVVQLGEHPVTDMMSYMKALSKFEKGQETTVQVQRASDTLTVSITF